VRSLRPAPEPPAQDLAIAEIADALDRGDDADAGELVQIGGAWNM